MPTATIDRRQRQGIYEVVRNHFADIAEAIWLAMESEEDFPLAESLSTEFVADTRLLADIGWAPEDERERFALTMPALELVPVIRRLLGEAEQVLHGADAQDREKARAQEDALDQRFLDGAWACEAVLGKLGHGV